MRRSGILHRSTGISLDVKLRALRGRGLQRAKEEIADTVERLIAEGFERERAPTGNKWASRVLPTGSWPLLRLSRRMFGSFLVKVSGSRIQVSNSAVSEQGRPYPLFHQRGTRKMAARKMVPDRGLPSRWRSQLNKAVKSALERLR
jgi:hypothetical protein